MRLNERRPSCSYVRGSANEEKYNNYHAVEAEESTLD
jgi:hypothetical protein